MTEPVVKAEETITIEMFDGTEKEFFMSYGLLSELTKLTPNLDVTSELYSDPELRGKFLSAIVSERTRTGKVLNKIDVLDFEAHNDELERLLAWGQANVTAFFIRNLQRFAEQMQALNPESPSTSTDTENGSTV